MSEPRWPATAAAAVRAALGDAGTGAPLIVATDRADTTVAYPPDRPETGWVELGSLTKPVTGTLLAAAVDAGLLALDDAVGRWLGGAGAVTVGQLATHTAGLPRTVATRALARPNDPYRDVDPDAALAELARAGAGGRYAYSNVGYQLLGLVLAAATGKPYDELVADWLADRFGVRGIAVADDVPAGALRPGHGVDGTPVASWSQPLPAAGGLCATADGVAQWLRANVDPPTDAARRAVAAAHTPVIAAGTDRWAGLGWLLDDAGTAWHTGETAGWSAAFVIDRRGGRALGLLADRTGRGQTLLDAARAVLAGRPVPAAGEVAPEWTRRAQDTAAALSAGRFAEVHAAMTPQLRERIPVPTLAATWQLHVLPTGPVHGIDASCQPRGRYVAAEVTLRGERRPARFALVFTPDARIARFALLRGDSAIPW